MSCSLAKKLNVGVLSPTNLSLEMADQSITYPRGMLEDVLVKVDTFIFSGGLCSS